MKEFSLEEFKKDPTKKVVTRDGRDVRIVCTDMKSRYKIVGLIYDKKDDTETAELFRENGTLFTHTSNYDLFFAPIKREGWINVYFSMDKGKYVGEEIYSSKEEAIKNNKYRIYIATIKIEWEE